MTRSITLFKVYFIAVIGFLLICLFYGQIPNDGMRNLTNTYITINTAVIAVAFAAIGINPNPNEDKIIKYFFRVSVISSLSLFICIFSYYLSYVSIISSLNNILYFAISTIFTFLSIFGIIYTIIELRPSYIKSESQIKE